MLARLSLVVESFCGFSERQAPLDMPDSALSVHNEALLKSEYSGQLFGCNDEHWAHAVCAILTEYAVYAITP